MRKSIQKLSFLCLAGLGVAIADFAAGATVSEEQNSTPPSYAPVAESRETGSGSAEWFDTQAFYWSSLFFVVPSNATSVTITSVAVRGDMGGNSKYVGFGLPGETRTNYQGNYAYCTQNYSTYTYTGRQPELVTKEGQRGFYHQLYVPSAVSSACFSTEGARASWGLRIYYTYNTQDVGPLQPPALQSITPGNGKLALNITPPSSGPTPDGYWGYCGRSAGQVSHSLMSPISIAASGVTNSYLAPTIDDERYVVGNVTGSVNISHQWRGELELKLFSPSGRSSTLWTGDELDSGTSLSFSFSNSDFNGDYASGVWRLQIEDRVTGDGGTLNDWNLAFNTREEFSGQSELGSDSKVTIYFLTNGETYNCYATSSLNTASGYDQSGASNSRSAVVGGAPGKPTISVEPEDKTALVSVNSVATGGLDITQYEGVCQSSQGARTSSSANKTIEVTPLTNGLGYLCKARARNQQGWGPYSDEEKVRPEEQASGGLPIWLLYVATNQSGGSGRGSGGGSGGTSANVPGTPGTPSAAPSNAQVTLTWAAPTSDGGAAISGYRIQQAYAGDTAYSTIVSNTGSAGTSYTVTFLNNGVSYQFRVAAINAAGTGANSAASNIVSP